MITNTTAKSTYVITNGVTEYPIGFSFDYNPDSTPQIKVYINKLSDTPLVYGTDYVISDDGLSVVLQSGYEVGDRLDIIRDIPMVQLSDYIIGRIDPEQIEEDFDSSVMRDQQLHEEIKFVGEVPFDHEERIRECEREIDDIQSLIPNQATDENQLADKEFVNSSIATSTATFRGTYSSLAELEEVTADMNDYGFVESVDAAGNTLYSRYKFDGDNWVFEYTLNNSSFTAAQWAAINSGITAGQVAAYHNTTGRNVGDIFFTMRNDNGLNGAVMCDGTQYNTTDFIGANAIGALLEAGKVPYVSLSQYATLLSTNGSVGVFGWDGVGNTAFRVPSLNDIFVETGTAAQIGDYIAPGVPNITGTIDSSYGTWRTLTTTGAFSKSGTHGTQAQGESGSSTQAITFDASRSSSIYGNSTTVQPKSVRYRAMVQLAVSASDEAVETCTQVLSDVADLQANKVAKGHEVIAFQAPTADNNYTGYRKYADGYIEIWGCGTTNGGNATQVVLPVTMADVYYNELVQGQTAADGYSNAQWHVMPVSTATSPKSTTSFYVQASITGYNLFFYWEVRGMAASN